MSEEWRIKSYYPTRVLIETDRVTDPQFNPILVCLTGGQVEMLRNLTQYLHRRSTFVSVMQPDSYLAPSNEEWDALQGIVADLEDTLMSDCMETVVAALEAMTEQIASMSACVCEIRTYQQRIAGMLPDLGGYVDVGTVTYERPEDTYGVPAIPPTDEARCELAQAFYWYWYDMATEVLLPAANSTADTITNAIIATSAFLGLASFVGIPAALLAALTAAVIAWAIDGSIANYTNWLFSIKDEVLCILYNTYPNYAAASTAMAVFIDAQVDLSYLEKQLTKTVWASEWHMTWVSLEQQTNDTWGDRMTPGACDDCVTPPIPGCVSVLPCNVADWSGAVCTEGYPRPGGSSMLHTAGELIVPANPSWLSVTWIPYVLGGGSGVATCKFDLYYPGSTVRVTIGTSGPHTAGIERTDIWMWNPSEWGTIAQLWCVPQVNTIHMVGYCIHDYDPSP